MDFTGLHPLIVAGTIGSGLIIVAYFLNQHGRLASSDWRFPAMNLVGAVLILASLHAEWNFPTLVIESFWVAISLYGLWQSLRRRHA